MKCFNHREIEAIGLCSACNKGVCSSCLNETSDTITCSEPCAAKIVEAERLFQRNVFITSNQSKYKNFMPSFFVAVGLSIIGLEFHSRGNLGLSSLMGFIFSGFGLALYFINKKWFKQIDEK